MDKLTKLQAALAAVTKDMYRLQKEIADIKKELDSSQLARTTTPATLTAATTSTTSTKRPCSPNQPAPPPPRKTAKSDKAQSQQSLASIARHFSPSDDKHGFRFISVPVRRWLPLHQMRAKLHQLHINTRPILDIQYPQEKVASLIHIGYESELRFQLKQFKIPLLDDFNPPDPANYQHPELNELSTNDRLTHAKYRISQRLCCSSQSFKTPIYNVVANFFVKLGQLDLDTLKSYGLAPPYQFTTGYIMDHDP